MQSAEVILGSAAQVFLQQLSCVQAPLSPVHVTVASFVMVKLAGQVPL